MSLLSRLSSSSSGSSSEQKCSKDLVILNRLGMHARPSARFVKLTSSFKSEIWVEKDGEQVNGKSIMGLMMLAAGQGSKLRVTAEGPDAETAMQNIENLVQSRFDEE